MQPSTQDEHYFLLMDPDIEVDPRAAVPPLEAVMGAWPLDPDGTVGPFRSNPDYRPSTPHAAADPFDALLRLAGRGDATAEQLQLTLRDMLFDIALNGDGRPLVVRSPDGVPCVAIATSGMQQELAQAPGWQRIDLITLVTMLPEETDVFFNPGVPMPFRLTADFIHDTLTMSDQEVAEAQQAERVEGRAEAVAGEGLHGPQGDEEGSGDDAADEQDAGGSGGHGHSFDELIGSPYIGEPISSITAPRRRRRGARRAPPRG